MSFTSFNSDVFFKKLMLISMISLLSLLSPITLSASSQFSRDISFGSFSNTTVGFYEFLNKFREALGLNKARTTASIGKKDSSLQLVGYSFENTENNDPDAILFATSIRTQETKKPDVVGETLVYPNPFSMSGQGGVICYELNQNMNIEIQVYDMMANMIMKDSYKPGADGGKEGYNKVRFTAADFGNQALAAGVYFYLLINDGEVLEKGKMAIIP